MVRQQWLMDQTFSSYLDTVVDALIEQGLETNTAIHSVYVVADYLAGEGKLPLFPDERSTPEQRGAWAVRAADFGLLEFALEAAA